MSARLPINTAGLFDRIKEAYEWASDKDIADDLGVSAQAVSNWRKGVGPSRATLGRIAEARSVPLEWLLTGDSSPRVSKTGVDSVDIRIRVSRELFDQISEEARARGRTGASIMSELLGEAMAARKELYERIRQLEATRGRSRSDRGQREQAGERETPSLTEYKPEFMDDFRPKVRKEKPKKKHEKKRA